MQQAASQGLHLLMEIDKTEQNRAFWENQFLKNKVKTTYSRWSALCFGELRF